MLNLRTQAERPANILNREQCNCTILDSFISLAQKLCNNFLCARLLNDSRLYGMDLSWQKSASFSTGNIIKIYKKTPRIIK